MIRAVHCVITTYDLSTTEHQHSDAKNYSGILLTESQFSDLAWMYSFGLIPVFFLNSREKYCGYSKPN